MRAPSPIVAALASLIVCASLAEGQYAHVVTVTVRPGTVSDYADRLLRVRQAADRIGDPRTVSVYRSLMGGSPFRFQLVTLFGDYSEMEDWMGGPTAILAQAFGEGEAQEMGEMVRDVIESVDISVYTLSPDFTSGLNAPGGGQRYLRVVTTEVEPGGDADYAAALRATKAIEDARGIKRNRWTRSEGESFTHVVTSVSDTIVGLAAPGPPGLLAEEYGDEIGGSIWGRAQAAVRSRTFETWQYDAELSRSPM